MLSVLIALGTIAPAPAHLRADDPIGQTTETDPESPDVIPALSEWTPESGTYEFGDRSRILVPGGEPALRQVAETFAQDLRERFDQRVVVVPSAVRPQSGDIVMAIDPGREDLGDEAYELTVGETAEITGATDTGAFYGTRTLLQMLTRDRTAPAGSTIDAPQYDERGAGVCPCEIKISMPRMERLIREMAYLKLNHLLLPLKVESEIHPEANKWSTYTREEAQQIADLAEEYHVTVVAEVNAPGHLEPFLFDRPDLQLVDVNGNNSARRMDITNPEAFDFYTDLIDEYLEIFPGDYWHMGADEYMLHDAYTNYPQIQEYAEERFGPDAEPEDAFIDFVNRVNEYVQSEHGKILRIWNDGLPLANIMHSEDSPHPQLDTEIIIHHWLDSYVQPHEFVDAGYSIINAAQSLYEDRGGKLPPHHFCPDAQRLAECVETMWDYGWEPGQFDGGDQLEPGHPQVTGAHLHTWQTVPEADTENQMERSLFMPLRFIAQRTWGGGDEIESYEAFSQTAADLGDPPGWDNIDYQPVPEGTYTIRSQATGGTGVLGAGTEERGSELIVGGTEAQWHLRHTDDGYYSIASPATGLCMNIPIASGLELLEGEPGVGEAPTMEPCDDSNLQKWEVTPSGQGPDLMITHAISQMRLTVADDGTVIQLPPDRLESQDIGWRLSLDTPTTSNLTVETSNSLLKPLTENTVTATVRNHGEEPLTQVDVALQAPGDWQVRPGTVAFEEIPAQGEVVAEFWVIPPEDSSDTDDFRLGADTTYTRAGTQESVAGAVDVQVDPIYCAVPDNRGIDPSDEFEGDELDGCRWSAVQDPDPDAFALSDGWLQVQSQDGELIGASPNSIKNLLLQPAPDGDWSVEVKMDAPLSEQYQQAGLIAHGDHDNFVHFVLVADNDPGTERNLYLALASEVDGQYRAGGEVLQFDPADDGGLWWLRLHKAGNTFTAEFSTDGQDWTPMPGEVVNDNIDDASRGMFATWEGFTAGFDYFRVLDEDA